MNETSNEHAIRSCYDRVDALYQQVLISDRNLALELNDFPEDYRESVRNLLHYVELRRHDIRQLQRDLRRLGLSSLGRLEANVQAGLQSVLRVLRHLSPHPIQKHLPEDIGSEDGDARLARHTGQLLGPQPEGRAARIMVTLSSEAAVDYSLVRDLVAAGMDVARINCAHDEPELWTAMAAHVHQAALETHRNCRILMDLAGPKLRTGAIQPGPRIRRFRPERDRRGVVLKPATILLYAGDIPPWPPEQTLPIDAELLKGLQKGDTLKLRDTRGRQRRLRIEERTEYGVLAVSDRTLYVEPGLTLVHRKHGQKRAKGRVGELPQTESWITLNVGDMLILTTSETPGEPAVIDAEGAILEPAHIPCTLPQIFDDVVPGAPIFFDDGKISGRVVNIAPGALHVRITVAGDNGSRLRADKGINLPQSILNIPALTEQDLAHLDTAIELADMVGLSFVRDPADVLLLHREFERRTSRPIGIVLKIETCRGFEQLPGLLLAGLKHPPLGVMVARGDLGVEVGFERMAEVQEEILWLCEAAHVPVIWATQVLELFNKRGVALRGEITDAAMSSRAECVMLNKGPHVVETVTFLEDIIFRMQDHHMKKTPMLRKLNVSEGRWREISYIHEWVGRSTFEIPD